MENIKNKKFNLLTAVRPLFKYQREWVWLCLCDCGNSTNVRISKLKNETTKSCGCFKSKNISAKYGEKHHNWKGYGGISGSFYYRMRQSAINRNLSFNVSMEYLHSLFCLQKGKCAYTNEQLVLPINVRQLRGENNETVASLDRISNDIGYEEGNVQWVCKRINYMKHIMQESYFLSFVKKIYEFRKL